MAFVSASSGQLLQLQRVAATETQSNAICTAENGRPFMTQCAGQSQQLNSFRQILCDDTNKEVCLHPKVSTGTSCRRLM